MNLKQISNLALGALFLSSVIPLASQVVPAARDRGVPLAVGYGPSVFNVDWGQGRMEGGTAWVDYNPTLGLPGLEGLGFELEVRDVSFNRGSNPKNFREDTALGGYTFTIRHFNNFQPVAKILVGLGSIDYTTSSNSTYAHATRFIAASAIGLQYRLSGGVWIRADYEAQVWSRFANIATVPQGVTLTAMYNFKRGHRN